MKFQAIVLVGALMLASATWAQTAPPENAGLTMRQQWVTVAPAQGPAWWRVSKGDSVVWIMAAPPRAPSRFPWDKRTFERRIKGARIMIVPYGEQGGYPPGEISPLLPAPLAQEVRLALVKLRQSPRPNMPLSFADALSLPGHYNDIHGLTETIRDDIMASVQRHGVPLVRVPKRTFQWRQGALSSDDPKLAACVSAIIRHVRTPPQAFRQAASFWAAGDVASSAAAGPSEVGANCRRHSAADRDIVLDFHMYEITEALRRPGKAVAMLSLDDIVAEDGILTRLRAHGYTVADPSQPLPEE